MRVFAALRTVPAALLVVALPAQAATEPCLSESEVRSMMAFSMPSVLSGVIVNCSRHVASDGFMRSRGQALVANYAAGKQAAWPGAKVAFLKFAGDKDPATVELLGGMPDAALQPFVEGMITSLVGSKLKPGQCVIADKMMRLLSPLPAENTVELLGTIIALTGSEQKKGAPSGITVCKA